MRLTSNELVIQYVQEAYKETRSVLTELQDKINALPTIEAWVPVKERLPKKKGYYLVTIFDDYRHISEICIEYWYGKRQGWSTAFEVTAWMPLPNSYEEGA